MVSCDRVIDVNKHLLTTDGEQTRPNTDQSKDATKAQLDETMGFIGLLNKNMSVCGRELVRTEMTATPPNAHPGWVTACESWSLGAHFTPNLQAAWYVRKCLPGSSTGLCLFQVV